MKKSLLFTILAAAFAVLLFVGGSHETVQAEGEHTHCVCGTGTLTAGDHTMHDNTQVWQEWTSTTTLPTYGDCTEDGYNYFYLKNNVTFNSTTKSWYVGTDGSNPRAADMGNKKIVICFNGKTITTTASGYRIMTAYAGQSNGADYWTANVDITFTDCQGTGEMKPIADATYSYGTRGVLFWLSGTNSKLTIYGGTFSGNGSSLRGSGHLIYAVSGSVLKLYGGTITGGKGVSFTETNGTIRYPQGGCIYSEGTVNIYGGTVSNGLVNNSLTDKPGQKGGGNIYCSGTLNISGGTITGGEVKSSSQSDHLGGNIYANVINMTGGTVSNGVVRETSAGGNGGNVYCYGTFRLSGGTITGGYAKTNGGNVRINKTFIMTGGTIENSANGENLFINIVATGEMSGGVIRNAASNSFNVAMNGYANYKNGIFTLKDGTIIRDAEHPGRNIYVNGSFYMQGGTVSGGSRLGNDTADTGRNYVGGNIYVNAAASRELPSGVTDETDYRPLLKITGGTISGGQAERGGNIFIGNGKHTIKNAVITGGIAKNDSASAAAHPRGGNIYMEYGTLSIEDSTISEGQALDTASKKYACGGNIFANSVATSVSLSGSTVVEDGVVNGGTAWAAGGNLALYCNATIGSGVQVLNGSSTQDGGNIYLTTSGRTFTIDGATVTGGTASTGGNFALDSGVKVTVTNSTVSGGTATARGGNFFVKGTNYGAELTLGSGTNITGGTAPTGGSIYMQISVSSTVPSDARGPKVTVNGATIDGGRATSGSGGNIYVGGNASAPGKLIIESGTITNGRAANKGGNIVVFYTNSTVAMSGGTISNGIAEGTGVGNSGGNVHMGDTNVSFTMTGGTVTGGKVISHGSTSSAWGIGGNFHVDSKTTLNVSGGTISDGYVKNADRNSGNGYNISVNGTLNVSGTAFIGGKGQVSDSDKTLGNNVATQAATGKIYISGGTVGTGEESTQVVVKDSLIEMTGGTAAALSCYKGLITVSGGRVSGYLGCSGSVAADTSIQVTGGYIQSVYYPTPANCTAELSGGFYAVEPPTSLVKEGLMKIPGTYSNPDTTDTTVYKFEIAEGVVIEATSRVKLGDMPVAAVTGGGPVKKNASYTLTAPAVTGYRLLGWYEGTTALSTDETYTGTATAAKTIEALYEYGPSTGFAVTVNGTTDYTISGTTVGTKYAVGTDVTVTYTGTGTFEGWVNGGGKLMSRDAVYTFTVSGDTELTANVASAAEPLVIFYTVNKQVYKARVISDTAENKLTDADFATVPAVTGKKNGRWTVGGTVVTTVAELTAKIGSALTANVNATYDADDAATYTLTVKGVEEGATGTPDAWTAYAAGDQLFENVNINDSVVLNAENGAKTFRYYADASGNVLSTAASTNVRYRENTTIYAVYGDSAYTAAEPTVTMITARRDGTTLYFEALRSIPEGYTVKEQGILFGTAAGLTYGADGVYKYVSSGQGANDVTALTLKNINASMTIYAAGYVIFTDGTAEGIIYTEEAAK